MARLTSLTAEIRMSSGRLRSDMRRVNNQFNRFTGNLRKSFGRLGTFASSALGTELLTGLVRSAKQSFETADSFAKLSRSVGLTAVDFQRLGHAFELAGSSQRTLVTALTTLAQRVGDGRDEMASYLRQFETLNLSISSLDGKTLRQQFDIVTEAIRQMTDETEKVNVTAKLFGGRAAKELGTILSSTAADIEKAGDALEQLGGVFTDDQLSKIENLNDQFTILGRVVSTNYTRALADALPEGVSFANLAREMGRAIYDMTRAFIDIGKWLYQHRELLQNVLLAWVAFRSIALAGAVITGIYALSKAVFALSTSFLALINPISVSIVLAIAAAASIALVVFGDWRDSTVDLVQTFQDGFSLTGRILGNLLDVVALVAAGFVQGFDVVKRTIVSSIASGLSSALSAINDWLRNVARAINAIYGTSLDIPEFLTSFEQGLANTAKGLDAFQDQSIKNFGAVRDAFGNTIDELGDNVNAWVDGSIQATTDLKDAFVSGFQGVKDEFLDLLGFADPNLLINQATDSIDLGNIQRQISADLDFEIDEPEIIAPDELTKFEMLGVDLVGNLRNSLADGIRDGDFSSVAKSLETSLAQTLSQFAAAGLTDLFGGILGSLFKGTPFGGFLDTAFGGSFHGGGVVPGARGQERLILAQGGETVFTPDQLSGLIQGSGQTTVNVNGVDQTSVERIVRRMAQQGVFSRTNLAYSRELGG